MSTSFETAGLSVFFVVRIIDEEVNAGGFWRSADAEADDIDAGTNIGYIGPGLGRTGSKRGCDV